MSEQKTEEEKEDMNDGKYLELCNQLKEINDKRDIEERKLKRKLYDYTHVILSAYGIIRSADEIMNTVHDIPYEAALIVDVARQQLREFIDDEILKLPKNDNPYDTPPIEILTTIITEENNIEQ